jgi:hypothetical protein
MHSILFRMILMVLVLLVLVLFSLASPVLASDGTAPVPPSTLGATLVAIAGAVTLLVQGIKRILETFGFEVGGLAAVALNVLLSLAGNVAAADPHEVLTLAFMVGLLLTVAGAAGIHDVLKRFNPSQPKTNEPV